MRRVSGRRIYHAALGAIVAAAAVAGASGCRSRPRPTRIVLITLDTLRYDAVFAGSGRESPMPRLLARAKTGLAFERFYAATSSTQPTHASLFTGLHPWQLGVSRNGLTLGEEHTTVAEGLKAAGFATAAVVASFPVAHRFGFGQGFDAYDEQLTEGSPGQGWEGHGDAEDGFYRLGERVTEVALAQIDRAQGDKQLFWFHYFDAHAPYGDSESGPRLRPHDLLRLARAGVDVRAQVTQARTLYDADAAHLDRWLETLFARLDRDAGRVDTHVIVTADHGESFGEDGSLAHGRRVTPGQIHVPFFVLSPRVTPGVRRDVAGSVDLPLTVYGLAGLPTRAPGGRDLLAAARGAAAFGMRRSFAATQREIRIDGKEHALDFNLFYAVGNDGRIHAGNQAEILPGEGSGEPGAAAQPLQALFGSFERQLEGTERPRSSDPEVERALKALGYVG